MPNKEWHPLFVTSLKEALSDALPGEVEIHPEFALSSKPLDIDVIVVKKSETARLSHPLTGIFKKYNLFEFKSPDDRLEPNDYFKGIAIALLYKVIEHPKILGMNQITVTFASRKHPKSMLEMLKLRGLQVRENMPVPGIYRVEGDVVPVQIMVLKELLGAEEAYMFAVFLTGKEKLRLDATLFLIRKHLEDPANPYRRELLEFKFKNQILTPKETEVAMEMINKLSERDRKKIEDLFENHPAGRAMMERFAAKNANKMAQDMANKMALDMANKIALDMAKVALTEGAGVDFVAKITRLPVDIVQNIKNELN